MWVKGSTLPRDSRSKVQEIPPLPTTTARSQSPTVEFTGLPCSRCPARRGNLCGSLADGDMHRLYALATESRFGAGDLLLEQGKAATHLYSIREGNGQVYRLTSDGRRQILSFLFPGYFLGLTSEDNYHYGAVALNDLAACRFDRAAVEDLIRQFPAMDRKLRFTLIRALDASLELVFTLGRKDSVRRVASFLWYMSYRQRQLNQPENPVHLPMGRADIADFLGLTTETVSRAFSELRRRGLVETRGIHDVAVTDLARLRELGEIEGDPAPARHNDPDYYPRKPRS
jgi:CRP/FNR family transcriptional regulator